MLTKLYDDMSEKPVDVDHLDQLWRNLGIVNADDIVRFLDDAKDADLRKKITRPYQ